MGPMSRIPPPRVFVPAFADLVAIRITATNARTNPMITSANPIVAMETALNVSQAQHDSRSLANFNSSRIFATCNVRKVVIVYKPRRGYHRKLSTKK
jgi:hypothetical protein